MFYFLSFLIPAKQSVPLTAFLPSRTPYINHILFGLSILSVLFHSVSNGYGSRLHIHQG